MHAHDGQFHAPFEDVPGQASAGLDRLRTELREDIADLDAAISMGSGATARGDQFTSLRVAATAQHRVIIVGVSHHIAYVPRELVQQQEEPPMITRFGPVGSTANGLHTEPMVKTRCSFHLYHRPCQPDRLQPASGSIDVTMDEGSP